MFGYLLSQLTSNFHKKGIVEETAGGMTDGEQCAKNSEIMSKTRASSTFLYVLNLTLVVTSLKGNLFIHTH